MRPFGSAVVENLSVVASGFFESVGKDREAVEGLIFVNAPTQLANDGIIPGEDGRRDGHGTEGERTANFPNKVCLCPALGLLGISPCRSTILRPAVGSGPNGFGLEVAYHLGLRESTVKTHRRNLLRKTATHGLQGLLGYLPPGREAKP